MAFEPVQIGAHTNMCLYTCPVVDLKAVVDISAPEARRIALSAQGFGGRASSRSPTVGRIDALITHLGALQIDSVNAVARSHYLPIFSRLGPYERSKLDASTSERQSTFEYWGHQASLLPVDLWPAMRWRMDRYRTRALQVADEPSVEGRVARLNRERPGYVDLVLGEVRDRGPLAAGELSDPGKSAGPWWGWSDGKLALEYLFATGEVTVAGRKGFTRQYDLPERVIAPNALSTSPLPVEDAQRMLLMRAAAALGVATVRDLADYYRMRFDVVGERVLELVAEGQLLPARVDGWGERAYLHAGAEAPARSSAQALLSPFDSLVWDRARTERIFGFRYRLEIYTPAARRVYGYYVLPLLVGGRLVARVDVRANRPASVLEVSGVFAEPGCATAKLAFAALTEIERLRNWLELDRLEIGVRGDLAPLLKV